MEVKFVGLDIAKNVFQVHGADESGKTLITKRISRKKLLPFFVNFPTCKIGIEACGGSHYWARELSSIGHEVKLISPQFVKPYVKTNKNDAADAEAICEALMRPTMRFVPHKSTNQQDILSIHRTRERLVHQRTALANHMRGLLLEYGVAIPQGITNLKKNIPLLLEDAENNLTPLFRCLLVKLMDEFQELYKKIEEWDRHILEICKKSEACRRLLEIPGIGVITASASIASIGKITHFKNGRHLSAWIGLVPRHVASGNKKTILRISKRGDKYLRYLLVHGARAALHRMKSYSSWAQALINRVGAHKACIALANKNARIIWALLSTGNRYDPILSHSDR